MDDNLVKARVLHSMRVFDNGDKKIAFLETKTKEGSNYYALTRESLEQLGELLSKNAARFEYSKKPN